MLFGMDLVLRKSRNWFELIKILYVMGLGIK